MVSQISVNSFYVERYSSDFYKVPNTISLGALRMNIQQRIKQKFQREWYEDQVHSDPTSIILSSSKLCYSIDVVVHLHYSQTHMAPPY
jgi:hypothetical protein